MSRFNMPKKPAPPANIAKEVQALPDLITPDTMARMKNWIRNLISNEQCTWTTAILAVAVIAVGAMIYIFEDKLCDFFDQVQDMMSGFIGRFTD